MTNVGKVFIVTAEWPDDDITDDYIVLAEESENAIAQVRLLYCGAVPRMNTHCLDLSQPHLILRKEE